MRRSSVALAALLVASSCLRSSTANAQPTHAKTDETNEGANVQRTRRIAVERFKGSTDAQTVRGAVVSALEAEVTLNVTSVLLLDKHKKMNDGSPEGYSALSEKLDLVALIHGKVGKGREGYIVALTVIGGRDGKSLGTLAFQAKSLPELRKKLNLELFDAIDPLLRRAAGEEPEPAPVPVVVSPPAPEPEPEPPKEEPKPEPEKKPEPEPKPEPKPEAKPNSASKQTSSSSARCPFLEFELAGGVTQRAFNFEGEESGALRGYHLRYAPYGAARATYRPWAHGGCELLSGFGIRAGYERTFGVTSTLAERELETTAFAYEAQLEFEFPLALFSVTPRAGFVYRHFQLNGKYVPDPRYSLLAAGLDGGLRAGKFLFELGWSARFVLDAGELQSDDWFSDATGFGFQGEARLGMAPTAWLDVYALGEYESYAFDLHPSSSGGPHGFASGSYDRYLRLGLGVRFNVPAHAGVK